MRFSRYSESRKTQEPVHTEGGQAAAQKPKQDVSGNKPLTFHVKGYIEQPSALPEVAAPE